MASLARSLGRVMRNNFRLHVAWLPLTTTFRLGDYGRWRGGVFLPLGNVVDDFGVTIEEVEGETIALDFVSEGVVLADVDVAGKAKADKTASGEVGLKIAAKASKSFVIKAPELTSSRVGNVAAIAAKLDRMRRRDDGPRWFSKYKMVTEVFSGENVTILATLEANTTIELRGRAGTSRDLLDGGVETAVSADKSLGISFVGARGPVGLRLVRVRQSGAPVASFGLDLEEGAEEEALIAYEDAWEEEPADDPEGEDEAGAEAAD